MTNSGCYDIFLPYLSASLCVPLGAKLLLAARVTVLVQIPLEFLVLLLLMGFQGCRSISNII